MTAIKVQPDTVWVPAETRERFSAPSDMLIGKTEQERNILLAIYAYPIIQNAIDTYQRLKHWQFLQYVPAKRPNKKFICCDIIGRGKPGSAIPMRYEMSPYQGDTDDVTNNDGEASDNFRRYFVDGLVDYVVVLHFLQPGIWLNLDQQDEERPGLKQGFVPMELLAPEVRQAIEWRKEHYGRSDQRVTDA